VFSEKVIRVGGAVGLLPLLVQHGVDPDALATEAGLSAAVFANPDNVVPFAALCRLLKLAEDHTGLADIGLRACVSTGLASLGKLGYLAANCATVERGLAALEAYLQVHDRGAVPVITCEDDTAYVGYEILVPGIPGANQMTFGALAIATNILRSLCGADFGLRQVTFAFPRPQSTSRFRSFFEAPVRFDADRNALAFDARWLARPIQTADPYLHAMLADDVRRDLDRVTESADDTIRRVVRSLVAGGRFSADETAAAFGVNRRTLARRLRERGTTFQALLDDARYGEAQRLLQSSALPVTEIASRLGYADTATFTRAFRRWSGTSPRRWHGRMRAPL
jgi:AraC-like DNA-binding protein